MQVLHIFEELVTLLDYFQKYQVFVHATYCNAMCLI